MVSLKSSKEHGSCPCTRGYRGPEWCLDDRSGNFPSQCWITDLGSICGFFSEWETLAEGTLFRNWPWAGHQWAISDQVYSWHAEVYSHTIHPQRHPQPIWEASHDTCGFSDYLKWAYDIVLQGKDDFKFRSWSSVSMCCLFLLMFLTLTLFHFIFYV